MKRSAEEIVHDVRVCMDEIGLNDSEFMEGSDNTALDTIIRSKIVEALRFVNGNADLELLSTDREMNGTVSGLPATGGMVSVELPTNFMRLCYARLDEWPMAMSDYVLFTDKEYAPLKDKYATGTWERPRLALARKSGKKMLELYSSKGSESGYSIGILTEPAETDGGYEVKDKLSAAFVYYLTGLVLLTLKDEHADAMFNQALNIMGISPQASAGDNA